MIDRHLVDENKPPSTKFTKKGGNRYFRLLKRQATLIGDLPDNCPDLFFPIEHLPDPAAHTVQLQFFGGPWYLSLGKSIGQLNEKRFYV
jgi:hypothetical protein